MDIIQNYLKDKLPERALEICVENFRLNNDIAQEFINWINTGEYTKENPVKVEGYSAEDIKNLTNSLDGARVYNMLIALRNNPEEAKNMIAKWFPIK